jgi:membrane complex biogenesis BtpA family protein
MVHLPPLPGSPLFDGDIHRVLERATSDAAVLADAGFRAVIVENYGDAPFFADQVPAVTVATMTRAVTHVAERTGLMMGVNVLRNDASAALAVAAATGAAFIRVNVLSGIMYTDQGPLVGQAAAAARLRHELCPGVAILADVFVKHATPPPGLSIEQAGLDTWERGGADALIVSGAGTGLPTDLGEATRLRRAVPEAPILIGSGVTPDNLAKLAGTADGAIVGSSLREGGIAGRPVDAGRARELVAAAASVGWR